MPIVLKGKNLKDDAKLKSQEKRVDKIIAWIKNSVESKGYIGHICFIYIQQEFQSVKIDWLAHDF